MKSSIVILLFALVLSACSEDQVKREAKIKRDKIYYVIKHFDYTRNDSDFNAPPPVYPSFYGYLNMILTDDTSKLYVHMIYHRSDACGTGRDLSKPPFLELKPDSLTEVASKDLVSFLGKRKWSNNIRESFTVISSEHDTIRNPIYKKVIDFFGSKKVKVYAVRNWTEEERYVLLAKVKNWPYNAHSIDWKIGFDVDFLPPKEQTED